MPRPCVKPRRHCLWRSAGNKVKCALAEKALDTFKQRIRQITRRTCGHSLSEVAEQLRRYVPGYTTNAIESVNARLRKIIKTRGHFPSDDAATKLIWLALRNITADWGRAAKDWKEAMNQFAILYADRFTTARG